MPMAQFLTIFAVYSFIIGSSSHLSRSSPAYCRNDWSHLLTTEDYSRKGHFSLNEDFPIKASNVRQSSSVQEVEKINDITMDTGYWASGGFLSVNGKIPILAEMAGNSGSFKSFI